MGSSRSKNVPDDKPVSIEIYNDLDEALGVVVRVANTVGLYFFTTSLSATSSQLLNAIFRSLDQPWVNTENLPALAAYWMKQKQQLDQLAYVD